uniref:Uncharacterized protein n=1 Tax=Candidozyma auris TaxID=498019 RepID=A0A0L0NVQ5_CANAR
MQAQQQTSASYVIVLYAGLSFQNFFTYWKQTVILLRGSGIYLDLSDPQSMYLSKKKKIKKNKKNSRGEPSELY